MICWTHLRQKRGVHTCSPLDLSAPDVYKRQVQDVPDVSEGEVTGQPQMDDLPGVRVQLPVSYTHLDVYKRQVRAYMDRVVERAKEEGYVSTLFGRRRWLPELKSSNFNTRSFGERVALNMPIQGTAADIIKLAMLRVRDRLSTEGMEGRLVLQVHDELIVECPEEEQGRVCALVEEEMERVISLSVPLLAETSAGKSWADAH